MARRSPWLDDRAALMVRLLSENHGMDIGADTARADISDQLDRIAEGMRIGRQAAKRYVTDEMIEELVEHIARTVNRHRTKLALTPESKPKALRVVRSWDAE